MYNSLELKFVSLPSLEEDKFNHSTELSIIALLLKFVRKEGHADLKKSQMMEVLEKSNIQLALL